GVDSRPPAIWIAVTAEAVIESENPILYNAGANWLYAVGRIKPGTNLLALQAKLSASLRQWMATQKNYVEHGADTLIPKQHVVLAPAGGGIQNMQQHTGSGLRLLMSISALVLLVACANIANLLLAKATARRSETS